MKLKFTFSVLSIFLIFFGWGQIAFYDFQDVASASGVSANITASDVSISVGNINYQNGTDDGGTRIGNSGTWNQSGFDESGKYLEFTITPDCGWQIDFSEIRLRFGRTNAGPQNVTVQYSLDGFATAGVTILSNGSVTSTAAGNLNSFSITTGLPTEVIEPLTIRIWGHDASGTGNLRFNNFRVFGTVSEATTCPGNENFDNAIDLLSNGSYNDGSFIGSKCIEWTYGHSRNEGDYPIDGNGLMLRRASDSFLEAEITGGVGAFSFEYRKAFTSNADRQLELIVDGVSVATTPVFGNTTSIEETDVYTFTFNINTEDDATIRIKNVGSTTTNRQATIDNISWTCFETCSGTEDYYRTKDSGNWSDFSIWEFSEDGATNWQDANCPPDFEANEILIRDGHNVDIVNDLTVDQVVVETGGTLSYSDGALNLLNGIGDDLMIQEGATFVFDGGAVPIYENAGVRVRVQSGGKIKVDENTSGLSSNIAGNGSSNRIIYEDGAIFEWNTITIFSSSNQTYFPDADENTIPIFRVNVNIGNIGANEPNHLTFNGILEANGNITFVNSSEKNFRNGIIGSGNVTQSESSGRFYFTGDTAYLGGSGILNLNGDRLNTFINVHLKLTSNKTINTTSSNINIGQLRLTDGSTLDLGEFQLSGTANIRLNSDVTIITKNQNGVGAALTDLSGGVDFQSPFEQTFIFNRDGVQNSSTILPDAFSTLIVRNGSILTLEKDVVLNDALKFEGNSKIVGDIASRTISIENSDVSAIEGEALEGAFRYFEGRLQRATDGASSYTFPVGYDGYGAQGFTIDVTGTNGSEILGYLEPNTSSPILNYAYCDLETRTSPGQQVGEGIAGQDGILDQVSFNLASPLQWNITNPSGGVSSYNLEVSANGGQDINPVQAADGTAIRYLMKNGEPGNAGVETGDGFPSFTQTGFLACPNQYSLTGLSSFSEFTLDGATQSGTLLPVELLYIHANGLENKYIKLSWATATEINNEGFEIQRSINGIDFETIGFTAGAGNYAGKLDYNFDDYEVKSNTTYYYRLKQIDYDGQFEHTKIVSASLNNKFANAHIRMYPIPTSHFLTLESDVEILHVAISDISGKRLNLQAQKNDAFIQFDLSPLSKGIYYFEINTQNGREMHKVIKQ